MKRVKGASSFLFRFLADLLTRRSRAVFAGAFYEQQRRCGTCQYFLPGKRRCLLKVF